MPTYNYKCTNCGHVTEFMAGMNQIIIEGSCSICEDCSKFVRTFSPPNSFILKGEGWGKDNYNKPKKESSNGKDIE